jgi:dTDP-glucose 4,6-dehydratase
MKVLLTGAAGFAGSHITEELVENGHDVIALDCLTYAGRLDRLLDIPRKSVRFIYHDFRCPLSLALLKQIGPVDAIIHNGAESHVARSFEDPQVFAESNIIGTLNILEAARQLKPAAVIYVSTDEVLGPTKGEPFVETDPLRPTNPYAASKAGGEFLAYSYVRSFGLPVIITRTMNMFGERQHPEKFVPLVISKILRREKIQIHGTLNGRVWTSGKRNWLHARAQANALLFLLQNGVVGEKYHISGEEQSNHGMAELISKYMGLYGSWEWATPNAPVHDISYSLNNSKLRNIGWKSPLDFEKSLQKTVEWTMAHQEFLKP